MCKILSILFLFVSCQTFAQVQEFLLNNGLKIIVKEDHRAPIAVSMLWYKVGSADEPGGLTGVSHALEHMMFKGTKKFPQGVFSKTIAALGGQQNAMTNHDYTVFYEKIKASELATAFELEADRMGHLEWGPSEFAKEIKVIQEERRMRTDDNPKALALERFLASAHLSAPYSHPVIGWMSDLRQMTINDVKEWYKRYYVPNNACLVVVGDVNSDSVYRLAQQYFGSLATKALNPSKEQKEPPALGKKSVNIEASVRVPSCFLGYSVPSFRTAKQTWEPYALELIAAILDAGESSRFTKNLVRGSHVASDTTSYYDPQSKYTTQFIVLGTPSQNHSLKDLRNSFLAELAVLKNTLIPEKELARIKNQIIAQKTFEKDSIFSQAMELGLLETVGLGWQRADDYNQAILKVSAEQIQQTARRYFQDKNMTQAQLKPSVSFEKKS